ncbi:DUF1573 domain-containing protein [Marinoscillum furvescens]|uniref:Uncharacterized protein DUF1573 n=1 Tax=Marinoscillum furvescens DSM 4134 TaxID=1122208 RepID=A0A3D9L5N2_MARFU|nr:DUF1573 domain-containing protein [Marinoscillum furvescens]REE00586.1 uncharacterized protein DUF1573 [Marinoscillum furvescens DSM 4134]
MKTKVNLLIMVLVAAVAFSCSNKELESRIAKLEGKVAELESKNSPASPNLSAAKEEPEVKPDGPLPSFEFPEESHDFGEIKEGDVVEKIFKFKNTGEAPLIISSATASCGCTVPVWPKEPIGVGEEGEIKVRFDSKGKPGIQNKTVTITANTYPKVNRLKIKANVQKADNPS